MDVDFEPALLGGIFAFCNAILCDLQICRSNCLERRKARPRGEERVVGEDHDDDNDHDDLEPVQEVEGEEEEGGGEEEPVGEDAEDAGSQATARECPAR